MKMIETPRLLLRVITVEEYKNIFAHYDQADAMAFFGFTTEERFLEEKKKYDGGVTTYRTSLMYFHLIEKQSSRVIGDCAFHNWYPQHSRSEIGYGMKDDAFKNQGYMKEALLPIIDYGFNEMKLNRIEAFISPRNIPSQKLVQHYGFREEGRLRDHYCNQGVIDDSLVFGLLRNEFEQKF